MMHTKIAHHKHIESFIHNHKIGVLVEYGMRTAITASVPAVAEFMRNVALQIAASNPDNIEKLLSQFSVKNPDESVGIMLSRISTFAGEEIEILRFVRWCTENTSAEPGEDPPPAAAAAMLRVVK